MEIVEKSERIQAIGEKVIAENEEFAWFKSFGVRICFMESDKEKKKAGDKLILGECIKVKDLYASFCPYDFLIVIYSPNVVELSDEQMEILLFHELLHVGVDDSGEETRYIVNPHDVEEFNKVIDRFGLHWADVR